LETPPKRRPGAVHLLLRQQRATLLQGTLLASSDCECVDVHIVEPVGSAMARCCRRSRMVAPGGSSVGGRHASHDVVSDERAPPPPRRLPLWQQRPLVVVVELTLRDDSGVVMCCGVCFCECGEFFEGGEYSMAVYHW